MRNFRKHYPNCCRRDLAGLNKGEARNALMHAIFMHRLEEIRARNPANQSCMLRSKVTAPLPIDTDRLFRRCADMRRSGLKPPLNTPVVRHIPLFSAATAPDSSLRCDG
ncbi:hypothetical protein EXT69_10570 [Pantoea agglomerans]|nr:hypothetical protein [Pantoea agglomerans]